MFKKRKASKFPSIEIFRDVMGIELTERRYNNLKSLSERLREGENVMLIILVLANLGLLKAKPFEDDFCEDSRQNSESK